MSSVKAKIELPSSLNDGIDDIAKTYKLNKWLVINILLIYGFEAVKKDEPRIDALLREANENRRT